VPAEDVFHDAGFLGYALTEYSGIILIYSASKSFYKLYKGVYLSLCSTIQSHVICCRIREHLPHADALFRSSCEHLLHGRLSNASYRIVDDTLDSFLIVGVHRQPEVSNHVFNLLTLIEREAPIDAVRNILLAEGFFEGTALGIGAIKDGDVIPWDMVVVVEVQHLTCNASSLFQVAVETVDVDGITLAFLRIDLLVDLSSVVFDDAVGSGNDVLCLTVVAFQFEEP